MKEKIQQHGPPSALYGLGFNWSCHLFHFKCYWLLDWRLGLTQSLCMASIPGVLSKH